MWEQLSIFFWSIAVGAFIMFTYDLFRMLRVAFESGEGLIFLEDVLFFAAAGLFTWFYLLESCRGQLRGFVIVGEFIGGLTYFLTLGRLVMKVSRPVIHFLQRTVDLLLLRPLRLIWKTAVKLLLALKKILWKIGNWFSRLLRLEKVWKLFKKEKKMPENGKIHLQGRYKLLYNLCAAFFSRLTIGRRSPPQTEQEVKHNEQAP